MTKRKTKREKFGKRSLQMQRLYELVFPSILVSRLPGLRILFMILVFELRVMVREGYAIRDIVTNDS